MLIDLFAGEDQPIYMSEADNKLAGKFATGEARKISTERFLKEGFPGDILELAGISGDPEMVCGG